MKFTTLSELRAWLDRLPQEYDLVAPRDVDGHVLYRPVSSGAEVLLDFERPELSAKDYLLPATEVILRIEQRGKDVALEEVMPDRRQVLFGVRPCDAHGMVALDALFLRQDPPDLYFRHHRERTTLVGLACPQMWEGCFCTSMGGAPDEPTHLDVLLRAVEGGYAVEAVTEKGAALLEGLALEEREGAAPSPNSEGGETFPPPPPPGLRGAGGEQGDRGGALPPQSWGGPRGGVPVTEPAKWRPLFEDPLWMRHGERCLSCRICTYVCPTCRCFDVTDRVVEVRAGVTRIERIRVWDACTSTNYRRIAGGHNPRPTKPERLRNRFYCKFCYYPEDFGPMACVGCGRCIVSCPVDIDITAVLRDVAGAG